MELTIFVSYTEADGYFMKVPDLPGCCSYGDSFIVTLLHLVDAIKLYLSDL